MAEYIEPAVANALVGRMLAEHLVELRLAVTEWDPEIMDVISKRLRLCKRLRLSCRNGGPTLVSVSKGLNIA